MWSNGAIPFRLTCSQICIMEILTDMWSIWQFGLLNSHVLLDSLSISLTAEIRHQDGQNPDKSPKIISLFITYRYSTCLF
jgi:hypothetical protein